MCILNLLKVNWVRIECKILQSSKSVSFLFVFKETWHRCLPVSYFNLYHQQTWNIHPCCNDKTPKCNKRRELSSSAMRVSFIKHKPALRMAPTSGAMFHRSKVMTCVDKQYTKPDYTRIWKLNPRSNHSANANITTAASVCVEASHTCVRVCLCVCVSLSLALAERINPMWRTSRRSWLFFHSEFQHR